MPQQYSIVAAALDASGTARPSFVWGDKSWTGSETQCSHVVYPARFTITPGIPKHMDPLLIASVAPFNMLYRMIFSNFTSPNQIDSLIHLKVKSIVDFLYKSDR